jgi:putative FmdB family regulatory protein
MGTRVYARRPDGDLGNAQVIEGASVYSLRMPTYEYACRNCGHRFDIWQSFTDEPLTICDVCGGELRKVFTPPAISFKGSGFYSTDSGKKPKPSGDKESKPSESKESKESKEGSTKPSDDKKKESSAPKAKEATQS